MVDSVERQALRHASGLAGGDEPLARRLGISIATLETWLTGEVSVPDEKLLALLSLLLESMERRSA